MSPVPDASAKPVDEDRSPGRPRRADARRNWEAILTTADALLVERGRDAAMADIAAAAGVGVGTLYRHFPSQHALLGTLMSRRFELATEKVLAVVAEKGSPFSRLRRALWIGAVDIATDPLTRLATRGGDGEAWKLAEPARLKFDDAFTPLIAEALAAGELRSDFVVDDVGMLLAGFCAIGDAARPERWKRLFEITVDGMRAGGPFSESDDDLAPGTTARRGQRPPRRPGGHR